MSVQPSRRAVLASTVAGVAVVGTAAAHTAAAANRPLPVSQDLALHAARRLTFGATPASVAEIRSTGLAAWVDQQLTLTPDLHAMLAAPLSALPMPAAAMNKTDGKAMLDLKTSTLARAVWGDHQLFEVLVEFWNNHLSIHGDTVGPLKVADDHEVIRKNALGTYTDMLLASCQSAAMLHYLNNDVSRGDQPNENYARELLELHTVGVNAGYTPAQIHDAARALTGLTRDPSTQTFVYNASWHYVGRVRVLGWTHVNDDRAKGLDVATSLVRYLAAHPLTAKRLATKLVRRFVGDPVPPALVASAAKVYLANGTAIVPTVRHILLSRDFARSAGRKTQRPFEWATAAARSLGLQQEASMLTGNASVVHMLQRLGQAPFEWVQPDGYPDTTAAWATTDSLLARWNTAQQLVNGGINGFKPLDTAALMGTPVPTTAGALVDRLVLRMLSLSTRTALRAALLKSVNLSAGQPIDKATAQRLTPQLAALILSSPEAMVR